MNTTMEVFEEYVENTLDGCKSYCHKPFRDITIAHHRELNLGTDSHCLAVKGWMQIRSLIYAMTDKVHEGLPFYPMALSITFRMQCYRSYK